MNCDCIERVNKVLEAYSTELDITFVGLSMKASLQVPTRWRDGVKPKRGKKPKALLISFCPLCGTKV